MRRYTRDDLNRAAIEASQLEVEFDSDLAPVLAREGVEAADTMQVANNVTEVMLASFAKKHGTIPPDLYTLMRSASIAAWHRGFITGLQLHRAPTAE